jgi:hypothetical protein
MIRTTLFAAALAAVAAVPANAGIGLQGFSLNGFSLNGFSLNGRQLNGMSTNGLQPGDPGINVGGHNGIGLNGRVIAIEF